MFRAYKDGAVGGLSSEHRGGLNGQRLGTGTQTEQLLHPERET